MDENKALSIWNNILKASLNIPGAKVNREDYIRKELSKHYADEIVKKAIELSPSKAGISKDIIEKISRSSIKWHTYKASAISFAAGIPGGWFMAGTIPADLSQFYWHIIVLIQKLIYIYGWPDLFEDEEKIDDETLSQITLFIGVMFGANGATTAVEKLAQGLASQVAKQLPKKALTKYGIYNLAKQIGKWIGLKVTKDTFARGLSKVVPILGGFISGGISFFSMKSMANKLKKHLKTLILAK